MSWGRLRVWNDDLIAPKSGFPPHPHRDMEIITYVRTGAITHQDSMGNKGRTAAGDVQVMSAGTGVRHAEYNLEDEDTTLFQIWIEPDRAGGQPGWGAKQFPKSDRSGAWSILASGKGDDGALGIRADARVAGVTLEAGQELAWETDARPPRLCGAGHRRIEVDGTAARQRPRRRRHHRRRNASSSGRSKARPRSC